ncbi:MAG: TRAP transporter substrate-binding protein [Betaproteobacteria bacterium]|nr:MAG: TRAP transporter substrate-binding protein [Betaproteobacteria bacterium]
MAKTTRGSATIKGAAGPDRRRVLKAASALTLGAAAGTLGFPAIVRSAQARRFLKPLVAGLNAKEGDPTYNSVSLVPKILREKYDVQLEFQIHPASSLGTDLSQLDAVQTGFIDITSNTTQQFSQYDKSFDVVDLPYIFTDWDMFYRVAKSDVWKKQAAAFEAKVPVKVLPPVGAGGFRLLSNNVRPLPEPGAVQGLKFRSLTSALDVDMFKAWGGNPTPIPWTEVYTALQQRVVNGYHVQPIWTFQFKHYEVLKYATEVKATFSIQFQVMNINTWKSIPEAIQKPLLMAFEEAAQIANEQDRKAEDFYKAELKKKGMEIYAPSAAELGKWRDAGEKVWATAGKDIDKGLIASLAKMRST